MNESLDIAGLRIETERVDDIPLVVGQMRRMELPEVLDSRLDSRVVTHGNRRGLSIGWTVVVWLAHVLSEADHRLSQVRPWAARRLETLRACTGQEIREEDLSDDRLADALRARADDEPGANVEHGLVLSLLRVYDLRPPGTRPTGAPPPYVRVDMTTARGYGQVDADGLFQVGHSKDHRPDLPQVKIALSTLDPLGLPVASAVVAGHHADDPLYRPLLKRVHDSLSVRGLLVVGDCKLAALETRADIHTYRNFYLCPLSAVQVPPPPWRAPSPRPRPRRDRRSASSDRSPTGRRSTSPTATSGPRTAAPCSTAGARSPGPSAACCGVRGCRRRPRRRRCAPAWSGRGRPART